MADAEPAAVMAMEVAVAVVAERLRPHFRRAAAHRHACAYLRGPLGGAERKNGWQLAEDAGYRQPRAMQRVLDRSAWDADAARDDLRAYVVDALGDAEVVLVVDETGFLRQGRKWLGSSASTAARRGGSRTARSGSSSPMPAPRGGRGWTTTRSGPGAAGTGT